MAEQVHKTQQYQYTANSNLVLQADRSFLPRRDQEPSGEPESLYGRISIKNFGDRAVTSHVWDDEEHRKRRKEDNGKFKHKRGHESKNLSKSKYSPRDILDVTEYYDIDDTYRPQTRETETVYELILSFIQGYLGAIPPEVLRSAAGDIIKTIKDENMKDLDKKKNVEEIIGETIESEKFSRLINLGKKLVDYNRQGDEEQQGESDNGIKDEHGVVVIFDENDEDGEGSLGGSEVGEDEDSGDDRSELMDTNVQEYLTNDHEASSARAGLINEEKLNDESTTSLLLSSRAADREPDVTSNDPGNKLDVDLDPHSVDAFWLQRIVSNYYSDAHTSQSKASKALSILSSPLTTRDCENELVNLFDYDKFSLVKLFMKNRDVIVWCTKLSRCANKEERESVESEINSLGLRWILQKLSIAPTRKVDEQQRRGVVEIDKGPVIQSYSTVVTSDMDTSEDSNQRNVGTKEQDGVIPKVIQNLASLMFDSAGHLMSNKKCYVPDGTVKKDKKGYQEIHVPSPPPAPVSENEKLIPVSELPSWSRHAFFDTKQLNRIQSKIYKTAFETDENMLICAPTGSGKTICALLTIMREIGKYLNMEDNTIDTESFKIVYIAPMKALASELVRNFSSRLEKYNIKVSELTGDTQFTMKTVSESQVIIATPEKWDVFSRKSSSLIHTKILSLMIIDEIHLLHDERGPVIEALVSRILRSSVNDTSLVRLIGLSATLPNYYDIAKFMRVNLDAGLFFFDNSYRPCPLKQQYIGITEKKPMLRYKLMNEVVYTKVKEEAGKNQVLIFCHSRKDTARTARAVKEAAIEEGTILNLLRQDAASREILMTEASTAKNTSLQELLPHGFAIHHAGMSRADRTLVEDLFSGGHVQVLVSTATLAWGVNMPAHTVIIKGTQIYNPEKGRWVELSPQDVLQMLGRAGRPQFDTTGEGIIITSQNELQYYLSLLNQQLPIESQLISKLHDILNSEIVLGTVRNRDEAVDWLGYTYLYLRMLKNSTLYGISADELARDSYLIQRRTDLIHTASIHLERHGLIRYDRKSGYLQATEMGRIASHYYVSHNSISIYNQHLRMHMSTTDILKMFSLSHEFRHITVREEEKLEMAKLLERVPIPVKEGAEEATAKINVLLQCYISQLKLEGFALMSDMVYIYQNASRILRAIFEICLKRGWARLTKEALSLYKMVEKRMWMSSSPLRQIPGFPLTVIKKLERKDFAWPKYFDLNPQELSELAGVPKSGKMLHKAVHQIPKLDLQVHVQPLNRSTLRLELIITPDFQMDDKISPNCSEMFWILVEDCDSEYILYYDIFILKKEYVEEDHSVVLTVPLTEPLPSNYFVSIISDTWLHSETRLPVPFKHLILPEKAPQHTELLDLQPLPISALGNAELEAVYNVECFSPIQTQVFNAMFHSDGNVFIGAPPGSDKRVCAEFALMRLWLQRDRSRCVYIAPYDESIEIISTYWKKKFGDVLGGKRFVSLTGETSADLKLLEVGDIIFSTPQNWDSISRRWKQRKNVQNVNLFIVSNIHLIGADVGPVIEIILSRMRYISAQLDNNIRIVTMGTSLLNARDIGEWIGASPSCIFNFNTSVRPTPLEIHIQGYPIGQSFSSVMLSLTRPVYSAVLELSSGKSALVFVPSRKQANITALDILTNLRLERKENLFVDNDIQEKYVKYIESISDSALKEMVRYGIAFYHEILDKLDRKVIEQLYDLGIIRVVVASRETCYGLPVKCDTVIIMGSQYYEGKETRYVDYTIADVLEMMGFATKLSEMAARCILMCPNVKKEFYKKFLYEALPVESHLDQLLHDHFNAEIVTKIIENKQDAVDYLTWTFFYRRMSQNPNYYNLKGISNVHLSDHLSQLVENTLEDLENSKCIEINGSDITFLNLGLVAAYYYTNYVTIEIFSVSLGPNLKVRSLLQIISTSAEFEDIPIRHHEEKLLSKVYSYVPIKVDSPNYNDPHFKTHVLLQSHFVRLKLSPDLGHDQQLVLRKIFRLLQCVVDVLSSNCWLSSTIAAIELAQMVVQAVFSYDSPLKQIPHMSEDLISKFKEHDVSNVIDLIDMDDSARLEILNSSLNKRQIAEVANFVNKYPNIDVSYEILDENVHKGGDISMSVTFERDVGTDSPNIEEIETVIAPLYPERKHEGWWIVVGVEKDNILLAIKRINIRIKEVVKLEFVIPEDIPSGPLGCKLYLFSDSYVGADQEYEFKINITEVDAMEE